MEDAISLPPVTLHYSEALIRRAVKVFWWRVTGWLYVLALTAAANSNRGRWGPRLLLSMRPTERTTSPSHFDAARRVRLQSGADL